MFRSFTSALPLLLASFVVHGQEASSPPAVGQPPARIAAQEEARAALDSLLRAYERGDVAMLQQQLDPAMIGYQRMIDGMRRDASVQKFPRIHLLDSSITSSPDLVMIQASWEKRYFGLANAQAGFAKGQATFLLKRSKNGWQLAAIGGDNPFASEAGTLAQLEARYLNHNCSIAPFQIHLAITLTDPDLAGLSQVAVELIASNGDRESLRLLAVAPGRFSFTTPISCGNTATPFDGLLFISGPTVLTVRYVDPNPGSGRPSATLTQQILVP